LWVVGEVQGCAWQACLLRFVVGAMLTNRFICFLVVLN